MILRKNVINKSFGKSFLEYILAEEYECKSFFDMNTTELRKHNK